SSVKFGKSGRCPSRGPGDLHNARPSKLCYRSGAAAKFQRPPIGRILQGAYMTEVLLFLHIVLFIFSFAFTAGIGILGDRIARAGDAKTIHAYFSAARPLSVVGGVGWILTAAIGGALASAFGFNMLAPWLLGS